MIMEMFVCGPIDNNTIVIVCEKTKKAAVLDPSFGSSDKVKRFINENQGCYILIFRIKID